MATLIESAGNALATAGTSITVTTAGAPSAGEKLIAVVYHSDDFPDTPSGWTQDGEYASTGVINIFSKTASGSEGTSFVFTAPTSGSMAARVLRYSGLGAFHSVSGGSSYVAGTLTGGILETAVTNVFLVAGGALRSTTLPTGDMTPSGGYSVVGTDLRATTTGTKAYLQVATQSAATTGNYQWIGTFTPATTSTGEAIAVGYAQASPDGTVTAVVATASAQAVAPAVSAQGSATVFAVVAAATAQGRVPSVTGNGNASVTAVRAQATTQFEAPVVGGETMVSGGGAATASAQMPAPTVTANGNVSVTAVRMIATALASAPSIPASVTAVAATASALLRAPAVSGGVVNGSVVAVVAQATVTARIPGVGVVETLPSNTSTGRVTGRFATAEVVIGDNDGVPNVFPITDATITFTSTASVLLNATATPVPIVIMPKPIVCTLDSQGYLVDSAGHRWCDLIATDDTDLTPSTRKWTVEFTGINIGKFDMTVPGGTTFDLTTKIPT